MIAVNLLTKNPVLTLSGINVFRDQFCAVKNVTLDFESGELVALSGRNGAGKSSLLLAIAGLTNFSGTLKFKESECHHGHHQPGIGYVPQRANLRWDLPMRAIDVVLTGTAGDHHLAGYKNKSKRVKLAWEALELVEGSHLGDRLLSTLSGGQAQRVALARAFLRDTPLVLLDEPTAHLDPGTEASVLDALRRLCVGRTAIIATHAKAARSYFGQRLEIADGRAQGSRLAGND